jgi:signal transduction histidine kinase
MKVVRSLVAREVARSVVAGLLAACLIGLGTFLVLSRSAEDQAISHATDITQVEGIGIVQPVLSDALLSRDVSALAALDNLVRARILNADVVRVKLWTAAGTVVYSDEPRLIGDRFDLAADEVRALTSGSAAANVSDLSEPENQYERSFGKLLQVYLPVRTPRGTPLLFETYQRYTAISQYQQSVWSSFLPVLLAGLALLLIVQIPLSVRLARRLRSSQVQREALLERVITASEQERRRIARDLHDGVVQRLAGVNFSLSALSRRFTSHRADQPDPAGISPAIDDASAQTRQAMRDLRTLIVEIAPPNLLTEGIDNAIRDLLEPLAARGVTTRLDAAPNGALPDSTVTLIFRVAQEALRNVGNHADASHVEVRLRHWGSRVRLEVEDDGRGFTDTQLEARRTDGHVGLSLLRDLVIDAGGSLDVASQPGHGTRVAVEVPC